jgi:hypothetical protein
MSSAIFDTADAVKSSSSSSSSSSSKKKQKSKGNKKASSSKKKEENPKKQKVKPSVELRRVILPANDSAHVVTWQKDTDDVLKLMQEVVGGNIERYPLPYNRHNVDLYVNDEGLIKQLPLNIHLASIGIHVYGNAIVACADKEGDDADIPKACSETTWKRYVKL